MDPNGSTPQAFAQLVERDAERWARLIKDQGIKAD
jgi:tripartite-type tricarboxylate transporter receptor subunit TctC